MTYHATFYGRTKGAIGIFYMIETTCEGDTLEAARLSLYERYEHITLWRLTPVEQTAPCGEEASTP